MGLTQTAKFISYINFIVLNGSIARPISISNSYDHPALSSPMSHPKTIPKQRWYAFRFTIQKGGPFHRRNLLRSKRLVQQTKAARHNDFVTPFQEVAWYASYHHAQHTQLGWNFLPTKLSNTIGLNSCLKS